MRWWAQPTGYWRTCSRNSRRRTREAVSHRHKSLKHEGHKGTLRGAEAKSPVLSIHLVASTPFLERPCVLAFRPFPFDLRLLTSRLKADSRSVAETPPWRGR